MGFFYWRQRWFPGAIDRFKDVIKQDPAFTNRDAVYFYLADSYMKVNQNALALPMLEKLVQEFEQSQYLPDAQKKIAEIKAQTQSK